MTATMKRSNVSTGGESVIQDPIQFAGNEIRKVNNQFDNKILGQKALTRTVTYAVVRGRNVLAVGRPGVGKTELAMGSSLAIKDAKSARFQGQTDSQPSDVTGYVDILGPEPDPWWGILIGNNVVLLDELSRAELMHSALLEAMENRQVTIPGKFGKTMPVEKHFCVIATMNDKGRNVKALDWALRDRFQVRVVVDTPDQQTLEDMLGHDYTIQGVTDLKTLKAVNVAIDSLQPTQNVKKYIARIVELTKPQYHIDDDKKTLVVLDAGPRGGLATLDVAKFLAVQDDDTNGITRKHIEEAARMTLPHRVELSGSALRKGISDVEFIEMVINRASKEV